MHSEKCYRASKSIRSQVPVTVSSQNHQEQNHIAICMNEVAIQSLMVSLCIVVRHIFPDREAKMFLSKGNDPGQTLRLDAGA